MLPEKLGWVKSLIISPCGPLCSLLGLPLGMLAGFSAQAPQENQVETLSPLRT